MMELSPEMREWFDCWVYLTPDQKQTVVAMLQAMSCNNTQQS